MNEVESSAIQCPYCWQIFDITVDCSVEEQSYIEDCQVCCKPIDLTVKLNNGRQVEVITHHESD